jgi:hypothetical protein
VVSATERLPVGERAVYQHLMAGIRNIGGSGDVLPAQQRIERIMPVFFIFGSIQHCIFGPGHRHPPRQRANATLKSREAEARGGCAPYARPHQPDINR